jgi:hypothetical protein
MSTSLLLYFIGVGGLLHNSKGIINYTTSASLVLGLVVTKLSLWRIFLKAPEVPEE